MKKLIFMLVLCAAVQPAVASTAKLDKMEVGSDLATIERGAEALVNDCRGCHGLKYIRYRDLAKLGIATAKIDEWRAGEPMESYLASLMSDDIAMQSFGKIPPDLSLMTRARQGGANYVYTYLTGYFVTPEGQPSNRVFPETRMPDILGMSMSAEPAQQEQIRTRARDIVSFLHWASDPHEGERHRLGYYVIGYLVAMTLLLYLVKRRVWARLDDAKN